MKIPPRKESRTALLRCPICGEPVRYVKGKPLPPNFPFCSSRCKMVDLNKWLNEEYVLSRELTPEEQIAITRTEPDAPEEP